MNRTIVKPARRLALLLAAGLFAVVVPATADACDKASARAIGTVVGIYTGEIAAGGPVYRLPPVSVVTDRRTELARMRHEDRAERDRQARTKAAAKPTAQRHGIDSPARLADNVSTDADT